MIAINRVYICLGHNCAMLISETISGYYNIQSQAQRLVTWKYRFSLQSLKLSKIELGEHVNGRLPSQGSDRVPDVGLNVIFLPFSRDNDEEVILRARLGDLFNPCNSLGVENVTPVVVSTGGSPLAPELPEEKKLFCFIPLTH